MRYNPVLIFCYKRLAALQSTIEALKQNIGATETDLIIYSDGAASQKEVEIISEVRNFVQTVSGFKSVTLEFSPINKGLANSIIYGVTKALTNADSVIVLEDDIVVSKNFLVFMNAALAYYSNNNKIFSISGYTTPIKFKATYEYDMYFTFRSYSWGWATWKSRWQTINWSIPEYDQISKKNKILLNRAGKDLLNMLQKYSLGKIDSWAVRWCYHQAINELLTVYPLVSKTINIGFGTDASHTDQKYNRYKTYLDKSDKMNFKFSDSVTPDPKFLKQFHAPFTFIKRLQYKILNTISKLFSPRTVV
jgi:GR25 family glycosyltransferase involved in LPS biosynthesis